MSGWLDKVHVYDIAGIGEALQSRLSVDQVTIRRFHLLEVWICEMCALTLEEAWLLEKIYSSNDDSVLNKLRFYIARNDFISHVGISSKFTHQYISISIIILGNQ
jgi:hypothetical protein